MTESTPSPSQVTESVVNKSVSTKMSLLGSAI